MPILLSVVTNILLSVVTINRPDNGNPPIGLLIVRLTGERIMLFIMTVAPIMACAKGLTIEIRDFEDKQKSSAV